MIGAGSNKLNVSGIKMECDEEVIDDIGEGLGVAAADTNEENRDYID